MRSTAAALATAARSPRPRPRLVVIPRRRTLGQSYAPTTMDISQNPGCTVLDAAAYQCATPYGPTHCDLVRECRPDLHFEYQMPYPTGNVNIWQLTPTGWQWQGPASAPASSLLPSSAIIPVGASAQVFSTGSTTPVLIPVAARAYAPPPAGGTTPPPAGPPASQVISVTTPGAGRPASAQPGLTDTLEEKLRQVPWWGWLAAAGVIAYTMRHRGR